MLDGVSEARRFQLRVSEDGIGQWARHQPPPVIRLGAELARRRLLRTKATSANTSGSHPGLLPQLWDPCRQAIVHARFAATALEAMNGGLRGCGSLELVRR